MNYLLKQISVFLSRFDPWSGYGDVLVAAFIFISVVIYCHLFYGRERWINMFYRRFFSLFRLVLDRKGII